jgi:hypothetical protein
VLDVDAFGAMPVTLRLFTKVFLTPSAMSLFLPPVTVNPSMVQ